jgi:hypothetical protein
MLLQDLPPSRSPGNVGHRTYFASRARMAPASVLPVPTTPASNALPGGRLDHLRVVSFEPRPTAQLHEPLRHQFPSVGEGNRCPPMLNLRASVMNDSNRDPRCPSTTNHVSSSTSKTRVVMEGHYQVRVALLKHLLVPDGTCGTPMTFPAGLEHLHKNPKTSRHGASQRVCPAGPAMDDLPR